jgi:aspartyl-tRNA(Asn)/glutamyl-tRNA(Gln) amidotransferase subunit B
MYEAVIGLEVHAQLRTRTKMFCACPVADDAAANRYVCPICLGHPGTLPALNAGAIRLAIRAGLALGCAVHARSLFARKQYFYADLPKGYQISQYESPLCTEGHVRFELDGVRRAIPLERIHVEEDTGKSLHEEAGWRLDFNRCGTPLVEIVSRPAMKSPAEAEGYLRSLHRTLVEAGVCTGDMEKGHFRCDANISVHRPGTPWGARVEVKNINSFRFVAKAIAFEIDRQVAILSGGSAVVSETRTWRNGETVSLRTKEGASDDRYFPEPDLGALVLADAEIESEAADLPGVPLDSWLLDRDAQRIDAFRERYGLAPYVAGVLMADASARALFEAAVATGGPPVEVANWVQGEVLRRNADGSVSPHLTPAGLVSLIAEIDAGTISRSQGKQVFDVLWKSGGDPKEIIARLGLAQMTDDGQIREAARAAIAANPSQVEKYRQGNPKVAGFFMGQVMRATGGRADPALTQRVVAEELDRV